MHESKHDCVLVRDSARRKGHTVSGGTNAFFHQLLVTNTPSIRPRARRNQRSYTNKHKDMLEVPERGNMRFVVNMACTLVPSTGSALSKRVMARKGGTFEFECSLRLHTEAKMFVIDRLLKCRASEKNCELPQSNHSRPHTTSSNLCAYGSLLGGQITSPPAVWSAHLSDLIA